LQTRAEKQEKCTAHFSEDKHPALHFNNSAAKACSAFLKIPIKLAGNLITRERALADVEKQT
jgi:hypothetical protein